MAEQILETLIRSEIKGDFVHWFMSVFKDHKDVCSMEEFSMFFLNFLRNQTDEYIKFIPPTTANAETEVNPSNVPETIDTPGREVVFPRRNQAERSIQDLSLSFASQVSIGPSSTGRNVSRNLFSPNEYEKSSHQSGFISMDSPKVTVLRRNHSGESPGMREYTNFPSPNTSAMHQQPWPQDTSSFESRFTRSSGTSTPVRRGNRQSSDNTHISSTAASPSTPLNRSKTSEKSSTPLCLADFIPTNITKQQKHSKSKAKETSTPKSNDKNSAKKAKADAGGKPKRRVVPTPVLNTSNAFTSPAFRTENNILEITKGEVVEQDNSGIVSEREVLKSQITAIAKEFEQHSPVRHSLQAIGEKLKASVTPAEAVEEVIDLKLVTGKKTLDRLVNIYATVIDLNLVTNVLSELSFVLNLLNMEMASTPPAVEDVETPEEAKGAGAKARHVPWNEVFKNRTNCIYFAIGVMNKEKQIFALFDVTTLRVIFENDRLEKLDKEFKEFLGCVYYHKMQMETVKSSHEAAFQSIRNFNNVFYQQENDTRNNFPSEREFTTFRKQRDLFYEILKTWEQKHLDPAFDFSSKLKVKVLSLLAVLDHPINMAHLAKLFTSQLIISSHFTDSPRELETALVNVDLSKLTKLQQRLVTPSNFSTDYQFPGHQAFFRDFLISADSSIVFIEQLKIALAAELIEMNDSSYEIFNLSSQSKDGKSDYNEYVVRPDTIATMRILAKFLGLAVSRPFDYDGTRNSLVDSKQIELRNMFDPAFDVLDLLKKAINERKLIITIPWLVEYLSMLDYVTIRLTYYRRLIELLHDLYILLPSKLCSLLKMRPTSIFIIRSCIGWLFEQPNIPEDYYKHQRDRSATNADNLFIYRDFKELTVLVPKNTYSNFMTNDKFVLTGLIEADSSKDELKCSIARKTTSDKDLLMPEVYGNKSGDISKSIMATFEPMLESILNVACPFLADFRVSIMPAKVSKSVSRTGRLRHITTKISESPLATASVQDNSDPQIKLIEAFLHSQSLSVRRTIEFVIERTTSAVVKDYQMEILIPSKDEALEKARDAQSAQVKTPNREEAYQIFTEAFKQAMLDWDREVPKMIETRVKKAMEALLPNETLDAVKQTCISLVIAKCLRKTEEWKVANLKGIEFYTREYSAKKLTKSTPSIVGSTILEIDLSKMEPHKVFIELQYILHKTSSRLHLVNFSEILTLCDDIITCLDTQVIPSSTKHTICITTIYLVQNLIKNFPEQFELQLMTKFLSIWRNEKLKDYIEIANVPSPTENIPTPEEDKGEVAEKAEMVFGELLSTYFITSLSDNRASFACLKQLLMELVKANLLTAEYIKGEFANLFKVDWPENVLNHIIELMCHIVETETPSIQAAKIEDELSTPEEKLLTVQEN